MVVNLNAASHRFKAVRTVKLMAAYVESMTH